MGTPGGAEAQPRRAVLPFEGGPSDESQRFADGTAVSIRSRLAGLSGLDVVAYYREDQYLVGERSPQAVADELGVSYLIRGVVEELGEYGRLLGGCFRCHRGCKKTFRYRGRQHPISPERCAPLRTQGSVRQYRCLAIFHYHFFTTEITKSIKG